MSAVCENTEYYMKGEWLLLLFCSTNPRTFEWIVVIHNKILDDVRKGYLGVEDNGRTKFSPK